MTKFKNQIRQILSRGKMAISILAFPDKYILLDRKLVAHHKLSFSQEGEDMVLARIFDRKKTGGFYVDVGAHHPQRFSNTYSYYLKGWRGINIDPLPGGMTLFNETRPDDINLELAISDEEDELVYYEFNEPAINGFSRELADERDGLLGFRLIGRRKIQTHGLADVLDEYLPDGQDITFLNVDVEGLDLQVLKSNNWKKYRPEIVLAEDLKDMPLGQMQTSPIIDYLSKQGYGLYSKTVKTLVFKRKDKF